MNIHIEFYLPWWGIALLAVYLFWRLWERTWTYFLALFHLKKVEQAQGLKPISRFMGYWVLLPKGLLHDFMLNMVLTLPLWDWPREWLVTGRLQRYVDGPDGWRRRFALALDADKIQPFDPGHIRKTEARNG